MGIALSLPGTALFSARGCAPVSSSWGFASPFATTRAATNLLDWLFATAALAKLAASGGATGLAGFSSETEFADSEAAAAGAVFESATDAGAAAEVSEAPRMRPKLPARAAAPNTRTSVTRRLRNF